MEKYRVVKITRHPYWINNVEYEVQKRFLGFLWWYNFQNIDACTTGIFKDLEKAKQCIEAHIQKDKREIVCTYTTKKKQ